MLPSAMDNFKVRVGQHLQVADTNFDNIKVRGGQQLWCFEGVGVENAILLNVSAGRPFFVSIDTYWTTSKFVPDNISAELELALSSRACSLAECILVEKVKTN